MSKKSAIVTGITGQDGSYLAEHLLENDFKVYGIKRRTSGHDLGQAKHLEKESNVEIIWKGPSQETDIAGQIAIIEDYINKNIDAIVIAACDAKALIPVLQKAGLAPAESDPADESGIPRSPAIPR